MAPDLGTRAARSLFVDLGPNDSDYVRGFREDWERDGRTRFHWTSPVASIRMPFVLSGDGFRLRARVRRHFIEPAIVTLTSEGRTVDAFSIEADLRTPYRIQEARLPARSGIDAFVLGIHSVSENPRPLGLAFDWIEIDRAQPSARIAPLPAMRWRAALVTLVALLAPWCFGARRLAFVHGLAMAAGVALFTAASPIAAERVLREGAWVYAAVAIACVGALALIRRRQAPVSSLTSPVLAGGLAVVALGALALRLLLLLHPQFFYPDVRVHAVFARALARQGFFEFMRGFTANQFRYSLGLQLENGHWYAFPYPPGFYVLAGPLVRWLSVTPEVAVSVVAAALNAASALVVYGIARRLGLSGRASLAAAAAVPLLPLFTTRLTLGYFPALAGQFADALVILWVLANLRRIDRPRVVLTLAVLVAVALLTYTQSLVNLGLLLPGFLVMQLAFDRAGWRRHAGLAVGGALGALLAFGLFYARYVPVVADMRRGIAMEGESIVLERIAHQERARLAADEKAEEGVDDPYAGPGFDLTRGVRKAASRLWIFYGAFAIPIAIGFLLLIERSAPELSRFSLVWASLYVLLNLGSASLPGPNLLRYNKDLEIVAPLFCACLALCAQWLFERRRAWAVLFATGYLGWGAWRALASFGARTFVEGR